MVVPLSLPQAVRAKSPAGGVELTAGGGEPTPNELDFALLKLEIPIDAEPLRVSAGAASVNHTIVVLQHPRRAPLRIAFGRITGFNPTGTRLRHNAATERGSSGAPCLNEDLDVVGLHNATRYPVTGPLADYNTAVPMQSLVQALVADNIQI
jgi:S1-C subfamily serine protease